MMNSQLGYAFTHWFCITRVSSGKPFNSCKNPCPRVNVAQVVDPLSEASCFSYLNHLRRL